MTTAALEPAGGLHEAWSFEARQALASSFQALATACPVEVMRIIFGSSREFDPGAELTTDFVELSDDVCAQLQAYLDSRTELFAQRKKNT